MSDNEGADSSGKKGGGTLWEVQIEMAKKEITMLTERIKMLKEYGRNETKHKKEEVKEQKKIEKVKEKEVAGVYKELEKVAKEASKGVKRKKGTGADGEPKPKRKVSAYNLYMKDATQDLIKAGNEMKQSERMGIIGQKWKALSDSEKKVYSDRAESMGDAPAAKPKATPKTPKNVTISSNVTSTPAPAYSSDDDSDDARRVVKSVPDNSSTDKKKDKKNKKNKKNKKKNKEKHARSSSDSD